MVWRLLVFLCLVSAQAGRAQDIGLGDIARVQAALQALDYPVSLVDGVWRDDTSAAVAQYLHDFASPDLTELGPQAVADLLARADLLRSQPGLVILPTAGWGYDPASGGGEVALWRPRDWLFASGRHAVAIEQIARVQPYSYDSAGGTVPAAWATAERDRARRWLEAELMRLDALGADAALFQQTLIKLDLALRIPMDLIPREVALDQVLPLLAILVERFPDGSVPSALAPALNQRLLTDLSLAVMTLECDQNGAVAPDKVALILAILQRYQAMAPGAPELMAAARDLGACTDDRTADRLFTWRTEVAAARGDPDLAFRIGAEHVRDAFRRGQVARAKELFAALFNAASEAQRIGLAAETPIDDLTTPDIAHRYRAEYVASLRGQDISSTAAAGSAANLAIDLLKRGYPFDLVDRIFTDTINPWCGPDRCDILEFHVMLMEIMRNSGDGAAALPILQPLIERAIAAGNSAAVAALGESRIEVLLSLGRFSEAERRIGEFVALSPQGASDPRVPGWQARLNLVAEEAQSIGVVFAASVSAYMDVVCADPDAQSVSHPEFDREAVLDDPAFLTEARRLHLAERLATCGANEYRRSEMLRLGCYLWAKDADLARLTDEMRAWLLAAQGWSGEYDSIILDTDAFACPMGIAEAGRLDLLKTFMDQVDDGSTAEGVVLLKLATRQDRPYAEWVSAWSGGMTEGVYRVDFPGIETAYRLKDPAAADLRAKALGSFLLAYSGASPDPWEIAYIRRLALDQAAGFAALNLDGIALFFLEAAAPELDAGPGPANVADILADAETARYALWRGRLALKTGDRVAALSFVAPIVEAYLQQVEQGTAGSVEDLGPWARRLRGFVALYLSALAADTHQLALTPVERVLAAQQLLAAAEASDTSGRLAARLSAADPELVRRYQDALRDWRGAMMAATGGAVPASDVIKARSRLETLRHDLERLDPAFSASSGLLIVPASSVMARAGAGAIVVLTSLPDALVVTTVQKDRVTVQALPLGRERIVAAVGGMRAVLLQDGDPVNADTVSLARVVLSGLGSAAALPERLTFVVDGPFVSLPFGALPLAIEDRQTFLGAEAALSITPSLALLAIGRDADGNGPDRPFLGIGDAVFSEPRAMEELGFVPKRLPETGTELRFVAAVLNAEVSEDLLLGPAATEAAVLAMSSAGELARYKTIQFATHGYFDNPGKLQEAGLLLSEPGQDEAGRDGILGVSEIYALRLDADLVILSACDTAAVAAGNRGLSDLARAFTYAGARNLIVTHWQVDTYAATELSRRLASEMKQNPGTDKATILKDVVRGLLDDPAAARFHHPRHWASHTVVGL